MLNVKFVIHEGDVVETPTEESEWKLADKVFRSLDEANLPYTISVGNHDMADAPNNQYHYLKWERCGFLFSHWGLGSRRTP